MGEYPWDVPLRLCVSARALFWQLVGDSGDAVFNQSHVEVDEESKTLVRQTEVGEQLLLVHWGELLDRFHLHQDLVFDDEIGTEACLDPCALIDHGDLGLPDHSQPTLLQFPGQGRDVDTFQQARPESGVNPKSGIYDLLGEVVFGHYPVQYISRKDAKIAKKTRRSCWRHRPSGVCLLLRGDP